MEQRLSVVTLGVQDLARARAFYEGLGWRASGISNDGIVFFQLNGMVFSLFSKPELAKDANLPGFGKGLPGVSLAHIVLSPAGVDNLLDRAQALGAMIVKPGNKTFWGGYSGYFLDLDGYLWEIAWNPHFQMDENGDIYLPPA